LGDNVTILAAFAAGVLSFISPCVLPLIPGYLSYVSGVTLDEMRGTGPDGVQTAPVAHARRRVLLTSIFFVLGFSLVFIALGATASAVGEFLLKRIRVLGQIAGLVIILFGLHTMGLLRIDWLYGEKRVQMKKKPTGLFGALLVGIAFAFGWTPCIGPILGGILAVAAAQETIGEGVKLLAVYSAGLGIPFLLTSVAINQFFTAFARIRRYYHAIEVVSGILLVVIGALILTDRFTIIAQWLTPYLPTF
jgi:cytochrome c-type biogenesis protein